MTYSFDGLKKNKAFKLILVLIVVFFALLIYFSRAKGADCQCSNWQCVMKCSDSYGGCRSECTCPDGNYYCPTDVMECGPGYYVCNRTSGCCPVGVVTPTPDPGDPGGPGTCSITSWSACNATCGGGVRFSNCGDQQACNTQACPTACNESCTTSAECTVLNAAWTCNASTSTCRLASNPTSLTCAACVPSCGGTVCGSTSAVPNQVTNVRVNGALSGNINLTSGSTLNITWSDPGVSDPNSNIDYYVIQVWDKANGATPPGTCNATTNCVRYQTASKIESYSVAASATHDNDIYVAVRAVNNTCVAVGWGAWSTNSSYNLVANVGGNFYSDPASTPDAFNNCSGSSSTAVDLSAETGTTVTSSIGGTSGAVTTSYLITDIPYAPSSAWDDHGFDVSLAINNTDPLNPLTCACPVDALDPYLCAHTDTGSPSLSEHIYLTTIDLSNDAWWQTSGGNIYGANSLISLIPDACSLDLTCNAFLVTQNADADAKSAGVPMTGASSMNSNGYFTERGASEPRVIGTNHDNLIKEDYAYFSRGVDLSTATTVSSPITSIPSGATPDADGTEIYYSSGDLTIDITSTENVVNGEKIVIFVDGDITFSSDPDMNMITVDQGGFIGFISSGNITFDASVGNITATDTNPNIAGVFVADGLIKVDGYSDAPLNDDALKDNKFVGEGTFVGWSGFSLTRSYDNTTNPLQKALNNTNPVEVFNFRPDFNLNIPETMMRPSLVWQEVN